MKPKRAIRITLVLTNGDVRRSGALTFNQAAEAMSNPKLRKRGIIQYQNYRITVGEKDTVRIPTLAYTVPGKGLTLAERFEWAANRIDHELNYCWRDPEGYREELKNVLRTTV